MKFKTTRQVIHDAFIAGVSALDIKTLYEEGGIQFTAKGADNKIIDHTEKGFIQQALEVQRHKDPLGWSWNMFAYAPLGTSSLENREVLLNWLIRRLAAEEGGGALRSKLPLLARVAMHDVAVEDVTGMRKRRKYSALAKAVGVDEERYKKHWHQYYVSFRGYCLSLPERSLPPISNVIWLMLDMEEGDVYAAENLRKAMKMPEAAAA